MSHVSERLLSISRQREGTIEETPFARLLTAVAVTGKSASIELHRTPFEKQIILEEGVPVDCRSNLAHETFGRFLVAKGKLSEDDFSATLNEAATRGVPHGEVLIDRGLISHTELYRMLQQNLARKLLDPFTWRSGSFKISFEAPKVVSPLKVRVPQLVLTGIGDFADQNEIDRAMNPLIGKTLVRNPAPPFSEEELKFSEDHTRVIEAVSPGKRIDELAEATGIPFDKLGRVLYGLTTIELILPADEIPRAATQKPPAEHIPEKPASPPSKAPEVPAAPPVTKIDSAKAAETENRLMKAYLSFRKLDPFDMLGLEEGAGHEEIEQGWLGFAERWAPWTFDSPELAKLKDKARDLFNAGAQAYAVLSSDDQRASLISRRRTLRAEAARAPARDRFRIKTDLLDSEQQFRKGKALMESGRYKEALSLLEFASDCDHQNSLYSAELAYCRFLLSPVVVTGSKSIEELQEVMRIDPECGLAWYYAGLIQKQLGRTEEAETYLRGAIKKMAPDRRPIEALKEMGK